MEEKYKIFLFGLDDAGKSTLLRYIKDKTVINNPEPTREFEIVDIIVEGLNFLIWDAPGQVDFRNTWDDGIIGTKILLFIVDTANKNRFQEARKELNNVLNKDDVKCVPLVVCFNKIDLEDSKNNLKQAVDVLKLSQIKNRDKFWLNTSIFNDESIKDLTFVIYNLLIILDARMNLKPIQDKYVIKTNEIN